MEILKKKHYELKRQIIKEKSSKHPKTNIVVTKFYWRKLILTEMLYKDNSMLLDQRS